MLGLALASSLVASRGWSRPEASPSELSVARRLFDEGKAAEDAGEFGPAAQKFRRAASIKDTPGIRFHLARCEEGQGAFVEALVEYDRARELLDSGVKAPDVEQLLAAARERAMSQVALLTLNVPSDVEGASVELDGKPLSPSVLGVALPVNPGKHRVLATAAGRSDHAYDVELQSGEGVKIDIELPIVSKTSVPAAASLPRSAPDAPRPSRAESSNVRTAVLVSEGTLAAVGITTGIIFTVLRSAASDRYETATQAVLAEVGGSDPDGVACAGTRPPAACSDLRAAEQDRARDASIAVAGFVTAGASAAAFGLTYWLWPESSGALGARAEVTPGGLRLQLRGRF
jgi:hypothetical protein